MEQNERKLESKQLVGITVRTTNDQEQDMENRKIYPCVIRYYHERLFDQIPSRKAPGTTYCAYTDYESDYRGEYTYFIGEEVNDLEGPLPEGFQSLLIPAQTYTVLTTDPAPMPDVVVNAWKTIWNMSPAELGGERSYQTDFEVYDERASDHHNVVLDLCIGITKK